MERLLNSTSKSSLLPILLINSLGLLFVYLVPTLSHYLAWPVYLLEPMRWVVILAVIHTNRYNAYILAATLPVFSMVTLGHPVLYKSLLIAMELIINVWVFLYLKTKLQSGALALGIAVIVSKVIYYVAKFAFISFALLSGSLVASPLYFQALVVLGISLYAFLIFRKR